MGAAVNVSPHALVREGPWVAESKKTHTAWRLGPACATPRMHLREELPFWMMPDSGREGVLLGVGSDAQVCRSCSSCSPVRSASLEASSSGVASGNATAQERRPSSPVQRALVIACAVVTVSALLWVSAVPTPSVSGHRLTLRVAQFQTQVAAEQRSQL